MNKINGSHPLKDNLNPDFYRQYGMIHRKASSFDQALSEVEVGWAGWRYRGISLEGGG